MKLAEQTKRWLDTPYSEISCIGFVVAFLREAGFAVPDCYGDLTVENHRPLWEQDPAGVEREMVRAVVALADQASIRFPKLYDFLVVRQYRLGRKALFPAAYVGNGKAITCFQNDGVRVFALDKNNRAVVARRFAKCQA